MYVHIVSGVKSYANSTDKHESIVSHACRQTCQLQMDEDEDLLTATHSLFTTFDNFSF